MNKTACALMFVVALAAIPSSEAFCWGCLGKVAGSFLSSWGRELPLEVEVHLTLKDPGLLPNERAQEGAFIAAKLSKLIVE
jgi:hypothetical protein